MYTVGYLSMYRNGYSSRYGCFRISSSETNPVMLCSCTIVASFKLRENRARDLLAGDLSKVRYFNV